MSVRSVVLIVFFYLQDTIEAWRKEERWIEQGYTYNLLVDKKGFVS